MAASSDEWADLAKRVMKGEMARAGIKHAELAKRLTDMGEAIPSERVKTAHSSKDYDAMGGMQQILMEVEAEERHEGAQIGTPYSQCAVLLKFREHR